MKKLLFILLFSLVVLSCEEPNELVGTISIQNSISNVSVSDIYFDNYGISFRLLPGQSEETQIFDLAENWPKTSNISFIMSSGGNLVYLETRSLYTLEAGANLEIVLRDTTAVVSP